MATYYVSPYGSDSNNGLGPDATHATNKPWATLNKALGTSGMSSGDTVYVCPGVYRQSVAPTMTSATVETFVAGDASNANGFTDGNGTRLTGGPVRLVGSPALLLDGTHYLTFSDMWFDGLAGNQAISTGSAQHITLRRCALTSGTGAAQCIRLSNPTASSLYWLIDSCYLFMIGRGYPVLLSVFTSASADYDLAVTVQNCVIVGGSYAVSHQPYLSLGFKPGGVTLRNNTFLCTEQILTRVNSSTTYPMSVVNSVIVSSNASVEANALGQIVENYNILASRTNVTAGVNSYAPGLSDLRQLAVDWYQPLQTRRLVAFGDMDGHSSALGFGSDGTHPSTDLLGRPRPCGTMTYGDSGTATSGTSTTLTDTGKKWPLTQFGGQLWCVKITGGTGSGQVKLINSHTATVLTVSGNWLTTPDSTSVYTIYQGNLATTGKATAGSTTTLTDSGGAWATNQWTGHTLVITAGTGSGQTTTVTSNTGTVLTVPTLATALDNTSEYKLYRGTDENTVAVAAGALERGNTMVLQTAVVRTGTSALRAIGPAVQDFEIAVNPVATTVLVWVRWNSTYAGTKPQLRVINGEEAGVSEATATATGSADTWEQLTLTFTPARAGLVTVRLQANSTATLGLSYWDDATVTPTVDPRGLDHARRSEPLAFLTGAGGVSRSRLVNG